MRVCTLAAPAMMAALFLNGCGQSGVGNYSTPESEKVECRMASVRSFSVSPASLQRGAATTIEVEWNLSSEVRSPVVQLTASDGITVVNLPLSLSSSPSGFPWDGPGNYIYSTAVTNPFGVGVAAGEVDLQATAVLVGDCSESGAPRSATAMTLTP